MIQEQEDYTSDDYSSEDYESDEYDYSYWENLDYLGGLDI